MAELGSTNIYGDLNVQNNNIKQVGKINNVTDAELANLEGSTSNIQAQLNGKANTSDIPTKFIHVGITSPANNQIGWVDTSL